MEPDATTQPSVVSVMVVHEPGSWFDETLAALAAQDYPNFRTLFLVASDDEAEIEQLTDRIRLILPAAFVRPAPSTRSFAVSANDVLRLVEGDNGFFLICHDDIAPAPDAVRLLVAELFRSNAGIVGPKLTDWDDPRLLQHVGLGIDRFGEIDPLVDVGELDQEQHDAVRDVFVIPSACMLIRADLFRSLGGFDPGITFYGEAIDLCWRAHHTGARVIVAPDARVRHRERLDERRPDLNPITLQSRHRMRAVAVNTGGSRLFPRSLQMVILAVVELVVGLFTGRFGEALASLRALGGLIPRTGSLIARRRAIQPQRVVPEREVLGLQNRGSSRLTSYLRGREVATYAGENTTVRRWRQATFGPLLAWFLILLLLTVGSRKYILSGVPAVGEFLPFPESPGDLFASYRSGFDSRGLGSTNPTPTGWAVLAFGSVFTLFRMALFQTVFVIGAFVVGAAGAWRLAQVFPANRARIVALVVYSGTPLIPAAFGRGDLSALVFFAGLPWLAHHLRRFAGLEPADPQAVLVDLADGVAWVSTRRRIRSIGFATLILAMVASFSPGPVGVWVVTGLLLAAGTILARGSWAVGAWLAGGTILIGLGGVVLNLPWSLTWSVDDLTGARVPNTGTSVPDILSLGGSDTRFALIGLGLYAPVVVALLISRAWRFTWSVRAALLVLVFGGAMIAGERGIVSAPMPPTSLLAVPLVLGLALSAAAMMGGFGDDVLRRDFGWRQPIAVIGNAAMVIGLIPAALAVGSGDWSTESIPTARLVELQFRADPEVGDYRVLYVGDPRVLPVPGREYVDGVAYAITDSGGLDVTDRWTTADTPGHDAVASALNLIATGSTLRAGRVLAPLGIRYVVVPSSTGVTEVDEATYPLPGGLLDSLNAQLDIGRVEAPPSIDVYQNLSFVPVVANLSGAAADASRLAGEATLARADLTEAPAAFTGADADLDATDRVSAGVLHVAVPFDDRIRLALAGEIIEPRPGFGITTAFDVPTDGVAVLQYEQDGSRRWWLIAQAVLWAAALLAALSPRTTLGRGRRGDAAPETLIDFSIEPEIDDDGGMDVIVDSSGSLGIDPGLVPSVEAPEEDHR